MTLISYVKKSRGPRNYSCDGTGEHVDDTERPGHPQPSAVVENVGSRRQANAARLGHGLSTTAGRRKGALGGMLLRDGAIYILAKLVPCALGFATTIGLTWVLSPDAYGVYGFGLTVVALGSNALFDWHALSFMRWYQSRGHEQRFMSTMLTIFAIVCALSAAVAGLAMLTGALRGLETEMWILTLGTWAYAWFEFTARIQVANFRPVRYLIMNLVRNGLVLSSGLLTAYLFGAPELVLCSAFLSMVVAASIYVTDGSIRFGRGCDPALARMMIAYGAPIGVTTICSGLTMSANRLLLAALADMRSIAYLTAAAALVQTTIGMLGAGIGSATYSIAVRAAESGDPAKVSQQLKQNFVYLAGILLPSAMGLTLVAPQLARVLLRPDYQTAVIETTPWLAVTAVLVGIRAHYVDHAFQLGRRTWLLAQVMVTSAVVNLILNCLLIPTWSYLGAAVAMTIAVGIALVHAAMLSRRVFPLPCPIQEIVRIGLATLIMAIAIELMPIWPGIIGLAARVGAGLMAYGASAIALDLLGLRELLLGRPRRGSWFVRRRSRQLRQYPPGDVAFPDRRATDAMTLQPPASAE
jgi:O-antigen/teichoic acid export membrane protein